MLSNVLNLSICELVIGLNVSGWCRLFQVREKLYELLVNCIPPEVILKVCGSLSYSILCHGFVARGVHNYCSGRVHNWLDFAEITGWVDEEAGFRAEARGLPLGCLLRKLLFPTFCQLALKPCLNRGSCSFLLMEMFQMTKTIIRRACKKCAPYSGYFGFSVHTGASDAAGSEGYLSPRRWASSTLVFA